MVFAGQAGATFELHLVESFAGAGKLSFATGTEGRRQLHRLSEGCLGCQAVVPQLGRFDSSWCADGK